MESPVIHAPLTDDPSALLLWNAKNKPLRHRAHEYNLHALQPHYVCVVERDSRHVVKVGSQIFCEILLHPRV